MLKRILPLLGLACLLALGLTACGGEKAQTASSPSTEPSSLVTPTPTPTPAPEAKAARVRAEGGLNVRKEPSTDSEILLLADDGALLPLLMDKATDGWYQVQVQGLTGYVSADFVEVTPITLAEYNTLKGPAAETTPAPEASEAASAPTATPTPQSTSDPNNQGVLTPPVDQQQSSAESSFPPEDGE